MPHKQDAKGEVVSNRSDLTRATVARKARTGECVTQEEGCTQSREIEGGRDEKKTVDSQLRS